MLGLWAMLEPKTLPRTGQRWRRGASLPQESVVSVLYELISIMSMVLGRRGRSIREVLGCGRASARRCSWYSSTTISLASPDIRGQRNHGDEDLKDENGDVLLQMADDDC